MKKASYWLITTLVLFSLSFPFAVSAQNRKIEGNEKRMALVIGNGGYKDSPLKNPVNDANDMAKALKKCNFKVLRATDVDRKSMRNLIRDFGDEINEGSGSFLKPRPIN